MAAGDTDLSICSDALILLGASPLSSFTEGTDAAQTCDRLYLTFETVCYPGIPGAGLIKRYSWPGLGTAPLNEFEHAYQLPSMLSGVQAVFETTSTNQAPLNDGWEIYGEELFTDLDSVYIDYQTSVDDKNAELLCAAAAHTAFCCRNSYYNNRPGHKSRLF